VRERQGRRNKCIGFSRVAGRAGLLFHRKSRMAVGSPSAAMDGCWRPVARWADFWPMRVRRAGCLGGLPVGCWAASPGGSNEVAVGQISFAGQKGMCCTVTFIILFDVFRRNYWCF
jgi:hypothetical protein